MSGKTDFYIDFYGPPFYKILCFGPKWYIVDSNISDTDLKDTVKNLETVFATADPDVE